MPERRKLSETLQKLKDFLRRPDNSPETLSQLHAIMIQEGLRIQAEERSWWSGMDMRQGLQNRGMDVEKIGVFAELAELRAKNYVSSIELSETEPFPRVLFRVTGSGQKAKNRTIILPTEKGTQIQGLPEATSSLH